MKNRTLKVFLVFVCGIANASPIQDATLEFAVEKGSWFFDTDIIRPDSRKKCKPQPICQEW